MANTLSVFERGLKLQPLAAGVINGIWKYSWHWPKDEYGCLTRKGWEKALKDCADEQMYCEKRGRQLAAMRIRIATLLAEMPDNS